MSPIAGQGGKGAEADDNESDEENIEFKSRVEQDEVDEPEDTTIYDRFSGLEDDPLLQTGGEDDETYNSLYSELEKAQGGVTPYSEASDLPPELEVARVENPNGPSSTPDDTPSSQGSVRSSPTNSELHSRVSTPSNVSGSPQPFDRRFQARRTSSQFTISRIASPAFLTNHSRQQSTSSQLSHQSQSETTDEVDLRPWEVVRWTKLRKISAQAFSEAGKRTFGRPVHLSIGAYIALGTSKGIILLFDYQQTLKSIIGQGTAAAECGAITAMALSADHSTIAGGHSNGSIFTWEISRPAKPFLQISPINIESLSRGKVDGHIQGCAILHLGFLGTRHTALVSADESGMAFSHLATRGLGSVGRSVTTTRILGRYPDPSTVPAAPRKPSSVLAFAPLPLGNVERATDDLGLTALLTPYLLVVVSTTPIAQTQFKTPRAKLVAAHSAMTGCLAWFPSVRLKDSAYSAKQRISATKLVYCWSNVLHVLEVQEIVDSAASNGIQRTDLSFRQRGSWQGDEAIVAVQWLSRSIIVVLTITQRLIILEDKSLNVSDTLDLNSKHIYHQDLFSQQLQLLVDKMEQDDPTLHGVVPDAYYMSFKAYKSRLFLLGTGDVSMGLMSNWADRLVALVGTGNYIAAINLATVYYEGSGDNVTIGLPEDDNTRNEMVQEKVLEMILASLRYIFSEDQIAADKDIRSRLSELIGPVFHACFTMKTMDFLFDDVYEWYSDASSQDLFLHVLEPHVVEGRISTVPPLVLKDLMNWYGAHSLGSRLEEMIISLDTESMDIDQVIMLCKTYQLYDAMIYVYNQALNDYVLPLIELLSIIKGLYGSSGPPHPSDDYEQKQRAAKIFPYLAYSLTGRQYPNGTEIPEKHASRAKATLYEFLFSSQAVPWPQPRGKVFKIQDNNATQPTYPYLHLLLRYDAPSFLSMLNEAFEDPFLNAHQEQVTNGNAPEQTTARSSGAAMNRQTLITILREVLQSSEFENVNRTYLDIFIARNFAKFSQFLLFSGAMLRALLIDLCHCPHIGLADECQLSVEYLLSVYHPPDLESLTVYFEQAGFFRILRSIYRANKLYGKWLETHFRDPNDKKMVFSAIADCLRPNSGLSKRQIQDVKIVLLEHVQGLEEIGIFEAASCLAHFAPDLLSQVFEKLDAARSQYLFLQGVIEPVVGDSPIDETFCKSHLDLYVRLMCRFAPHHVADYIRVARTGDLKLEVCVPIMEKNGVIDAAVILMAKDGLPQQAMDRLIKHLFTLRTALVGLLSEISRSPDLTNSEETLDDLLDTIDKYVKLGVWLCQGQSGYREDSDLKKHRKMNFESVTEADLTTSERLWLDLVDNVVSISIVVPTTSSQRGSDQSKSLQDVSYDATAKVEKAETRVRNCVQQMFTALLASTAGSSKDSTGQTLSANSKLPKDGSTPSFLAILRLFLIRAAQHSPTLSDLRSILSNVFAAYVFEESLLALTNAFIGKDVFSQVENADRGRRSGWRPKSQICEGCRRRAWGTGAGRGLWEDWRARKNDAAIKKEQQNQELALTKGNSNLESDATGAGKGKGRATIPAGLAAVEVTESTTRVDGNADVQQKHDSLVLFSCTHLWHRKCLERAGGESKEAGEHDARSAGDSARFHCPLCS